MGLIPQSLSNPAGVRLQRGSMALTKKQAFPTTCSLTTIGFSSSLRTGLPAVTPRGAPGNGAVRVGKGDWHPSRHRGWRQLAGFS